MKRFALTLAALATTLLLTSCGYDGLEQPPAMPTTSPSTPSSDLSSLTASQVAAHMLRAHPDAEWRWYLGTLEIKDGAVRMEIGADYKDAAVEVCKALREAIRASKMNQMLVTVASTESGFPLAQANPESKFEKGCEA